MKIVHIDEVTAPIASSIANAYIDFSKMTLSLVAVITDVTREGRRVVGYGFNSNGRYGQGGLIRERFAPRVLEASPNSLLNDAGDNLDPDRIWATMMKNEKPHGERSVAVGTIDMAVWDAVSKIAGKPLPSRCAGISRRAGGAGHAFVRWPACDSAAIAGRGECRNGGGDRRRAAASRVLAFDLIARTDTR
jgi:L-alanine-DL-glutamate epimerase-like enolase superfamily enzyme